MTSTEMRHNGHGLKQNFIFKLILSERNIPKEQGRHTAQHLMQWR